MTFAEAAAIPQAGMLAVQGLRDIDRLEPGGRLLVNGAGGGVGTFAIQLAKLRGVHVTGVDSASKLELLRSLGCDRVVDYEQENFARSDERYDMVLDVRTNRPLADYLRVLSPDGLHVTVGGELGKLLQIVAFGRFFTRGTRVTL